jgi:hypothetical protein
MVPGPDMTPPDTTLTDLASPPEETAIVPLPSTMVLRTEPPDRISSTLLNRTEPPVCTWPDEITVVVMLYPPTRAAVARATGSI